MKLRLWSRSAEANNGGTVDSDNPDQAASPLTRPVSHRGFLKLLATAGLVGAAQLAGPPQRVEATYIPGGGGDTVDTNLTVQGNLTVSGTIYAGTRKVADSGGCYYAD